MKRICLMMLFCMTLSSVWSQTEQKNSIKINPLSLLLSTGSVSFEHKTDDDHAWQLGLAYLGYNDLSIKYSGIAITPEYRIYFSHHAISGVYVAPFLRYQNFKLTNDAHGTARYTSFGGGAVMGRQWVYHRGFVLDLFAGPVYNAGNLSDISDAAIFNKPGFGLDGLGIRAGLSLGFGF